MHWEVLAATDFFTVELWTAKGLIRYHVLFVIRLATREVQLAGLVSWIDEFDPSCTAPIPGGCSAELFNTTTHRKFQHAMNRSP